MEKLLTDSHLMLMLIFVDDSCIKLIMDTLLALSTLALAFVTAWMAWSTRELANESRKASFRQIGVQTWLEFTKRFDSEKMLNARANLASHIQTYGNDAQYFKEISETVLNFFEDLGTCYHNKYIDEKLAIDSFSFYVCRYWEVAKPYIEHERENHNRDSSLFSEFEKLAAMMKSQNDVVDASEIKIFLQDEKNVNF
jgi:hypothetical protein